MASVKIQEVTHYLESLAPLNLQESYDNAGLITGNPETIVKGILVSLDCTEEVVDEAIANNCNLIVSHHPIVFKGLKKLTGGNYVERVIIKAIKNDIALYAIHTNLDNVSHGVNKKISEKIGLINLEILAPKSNTLSKLVTFVPKKDANKVLQALHEAGAGHIGNYTHCSFQTDGTGSFRPNALAKPHIGEALKQEFVDETRIEVIFQQHKTKAVFSALNAAHPYEEVAYYVTSLLNQNQDIGAGMIGELPSPLAPIDFLKQLKINMNLEIIRHTAFIDRPIKKVAVCGGSGSFLLSNAIRAKADAFVTADFKYHEFFDADNQLIIADIGHYESEVCTKELLQDVLMKKFSNFAIIFSRVVTNPIRYL
jgi:dinuclear metal center YbgI/SA1388 family protein